MDLQELEKRAPLPWEKKIQGMPNILMERAI